MLRNKLFPAMVEDVINGNATTQVFTVKRLDLPKIKKFLIDGKLIKYRNWDTEKYETVKLFDSNEGYEMICNYLEKWGKS